MKSYSITLPEHLKRHYLILRITLYLIVISLGIFFVFRTLFPTLQFSFNFKTPSSSKNNLLDPRSDTESLRRNGKIETAGTLLADASAIGNFSRATINITLEKKSTVPNTLHFSLRRSYRSFFLPTGPAIGQFAQESLYRIDDTYYALRDGILYPFVSEQAYLSRYPKSFALPETESLRKKYPIAENWIGFRIGSLVSFADGIFIIVSDTEMRPIGSADIFLALGYHFEDVIPGSEEEIGIYKRGRIFLLGVPHPDGTLLLDTDTQTYFLLDHGFKRPVSGPYLDFILTQQSPVIASSLSSQKVSTCDPTPSLFGRTFSCTTPIDILTLGYGNDFEIRLESTDTDIDINTLSLALETERSRQSMLTILSQIKQRLLARFGANE